MQITINASTISIISAVVAVIAMFVSFSQACIARKALRLSEIQEQQKKPHFDFHEILDCYVINDYSDDYVHFKFLIFCNNLSDKPMVIKGLTLQILGDSQNMVLHPNIHETRSPIGLSLPANQGITEWIQFDLLREQYLSLRILSYTLKIEDSYGNIRERAAIFVREEVFQHE